MTLKDLMLPNDLSRDVLHGHIHHEILRRGPLVRQHPFVSLFDSISCYSPVASRAAAFCRRCGSIGSILSYRPSRTTV